MQRACKAFAFCDNRNINSKAFFSDLYMLLCKKILSGTFRDVGMQKKASCRYHDDLRIYAYGINASGCNVHINRSLKMRTLAVRPVFGQARPLGIVGFFRDLHSTCPLTVGLHQN